MSVFALVSVYIRSTFMYVHTYVHIHTYVRMYTCIYGAKWLPPRGTCEDAEKNCEEKELPQPMNKKSEI